MGGLAGQFRAVAFPTPRRIVQPPTPHTTMDPLMKKPYRLRKVPSGIEGFDAITGGGLPQERTSLVMGGPGTGKTVFALQTLVNGALQNGEPGIFVAFEENARQIVANAATFGWDLPALEKHKLFFLDARVRPDRVNPDQFDLSSMLAGIQVMVKQIGAKRIVFDSIDILLNLLDHPAAERREIFRLHDWLLASGLTGLVTTKVEDNRLLTEERFGFLKFMVDCVVLLTHRVVDQVSWRGLRVVKYRGSAFAENEFPLVIGHTGMEVSSLRATEPVYAASTERVSTGIAALDEMLGGGYFRRSSVLITGSPGTAKSILGGAFAEAACLRKERTLYLGFEESPAELMRNLASVGIRLAPHLKNGRLRICTARAEGTNADAHLMKLKAAIRAHQPRCVVIDPLSTMAKAGGQLLAQSFAERLVQLAKSEGITLVCTSLLENPDAPDAAVPLGISTIADTWIHLFYVVQSGERNRALSIIKSRGMNHSNQVRELILTDRGVVLTDVYAAGGDVLLGTLRWQRESAEEAEQHQIRAEVELKRREIELAREELEARVAALNRELSMKQTELDYLLKTEAMRKNLGSAQEPEPRPAGNRRASRRDARR